jgi:hypothetical protein
VKIGKSVWTLIEGRAVKVTIVSFGKGLYATVKFEGGRQRDVLKEFLYAKRPLDASEAS